MSEAQAERVLPELRLERDRLQKALQNCAVPVENVVLHPTAVSACLGTVELLRSVIAAHRSNNELQVKATFREFVETITVTPMAADGRYMIKIMSRLTKLVEGEHFPSGSVIA